MRYNKAMEILVIGAHPDDELMGAGGTIGKHLQKKDKVSILTITEGRLDPIDQKLDTVPITDIISKIEIELLKTTPSIVYTHISSDINKDHSIVCEATKVACRPFRSKVKAVYGYASSQSCFDNFNPNHFVKLNASNMKYKMEEMVKLYLEEMNAPSRNTRAIASTAKYWGIQAGCLYAEAFETLLSIA